MKTKIINALTAGLFFSLIYALWTGWEGLKITGTFILLIFAACAIKE